LDPSTSGQAAFVACPFLWRNAWRSRGLIIEAAHIEGRPLTESVVIISNPIILIILAIIVVALLPLALWLGLTAIWLGFGLFAGAFVYYFTLYVFGIPLLAIALGVIVTLMIWGALFR
jgi:hypothetical protein